MVRIFSIILFAVSSIFAISGTALFAQGGSNYSAYGIGDINRSGGAAYDGLAGTSLAFPNNTSINLNNPALWSKVDKTRLKVGYRFNQNYINSENTELFQNNGWLSGVGSVMSIDTSMGISAGFGIFPFSNVNYLISTPISVEVEGVVQNGTTTYQGSGGLTMAMIGGSVEPLEGLALGAIGFVNFGKIKNSVETEFYDSFVFNYEVDSENFFLGYGFKAGAFYEITSGLSMGGYYELQPEMDLSSNTIYHSDIAADTTVSTESLVTLPNAFGLGLSYASGKFIFGADAEFQDFSGFEFRRGSETEFGNSLRYSIGIERVGNSRARDFLDSWGYRFGLGYKQHYYNVRGNEINEIFGSLGFEIPVPETSVIDAAITLGYRGTENSGLVREYFGRLSVDISIGDTWFKPFRRQY